MKKNIIVFLIFCSFYSANSQDISVAKNLFGVQMGLLSASVLNETRLDRKFTLHSELGVVVGLYREKTNNSETNNKTQTLSLPYVAVEPRYYYGLDRRSRLGKNIKNNGSNYFSLATTYYAANLPLTNSSKTGKVFSSITFVPQFGIRRNFAKNFNYEFAFGIGHKYNFFNSNDGCNCSKNQTALDIQAKIGYNF